MRAGVQLTALQNCKHHSWASNGENRVNVDHKPECYSITFPLRPQNLRKTFNYSFLVWASTRISKWGRPRLAMRSYIEYVPNEWGANVIKHPGTMKYWVEPHSSAHKFRWQWIICPTSQVSSLTWKFSSNSFPFTTRAVTMFLLSFGSKLLVPNVCNSTIRKWRCVNPVCFNFWMAWDHVPWWIQFGGTWTSFFNAFEHNERISCLGSS